MTHVIITAAPVPGGGALLMLAGGWLAAQGCRIVALLLPARRS